MAGIVYDALVEDYEPGLTGDEIAAMFDRMRVRLVALRERIMASGVDAAALTARFPQADQLALAGRVAGLFGYDFDHGRIDLAVHPFSSGSGADVRITTRVDESDPFNCLYSTIHEVGHAAYEQHVDPCHRLTRLGQGVSMGVHESQSRIFENQLGRSEAFCGWLHGAMVETFGAFEPSDPAGFYAAVNRVRSGYIRTEADEVHYNLHIMLRFDLERALIRGDLQVADLEAAWNDRFEADFGLAVDRPSQGLLQDVHWSAGLFGYFPTYALGNVYAGCLHAALRTDIAAARRSDGAGRSGRGHGLAGRQGATAWLGAGAARGDRDRHGRGCQRGPPAGLSRREIRRALPAVRRARFFQKIWTKSFERICAPGRCGHCVQSGARFSMKACMPSSVSAFSMFSTITSRVSA